MKGQGPKLVANVCMHALNM